MVNSMIVQSIATITTKIDALNLNHISTYFQCTPSLSGTIRVLPKSRSNLIMSSRRRERGMGEDIAVSI